MCPYESRCGRRKTRRISTCAQTCVFSSALLSPLKSIPLCRAPAVRISLMYTEGRTGMLRITIYLFGSLYSVQKYISVWGVKGKESESIIYCVNQLIESKEQNEKRKKDSQKKALHVNLHKSQKVFQSTKNSSTPFKNSAHHRSTIPSANPFSS